MTLESNTSTPLAAREHARAMADSRADTMQTIPARDAIDLPAGVRSEDLLWAETIGAGGYASRILTRGTRLQLTDLEGDACVGLLVFNADAPAERLNVADTVKVQWNAYLGSEKLLLSDMGRVLMSIVEDSSGSTHDAFCGCSNEGSNARKYGSGGVYGPYPNARDRIAVALAKHGMSRRDIMPNLNLFRGVRIAGDGSVSLVERTPKPGAHLVLRAEMNVLVAMANTPHPLDDRAEYRATPVRIHAWRGPVTSAEDPIRSATPEGVRAFQNVEDYYDR